MLQPFLFILLFSSAFGCKLIINEIISNMYRFDVVGEADFVELKAVNCETAPDLNPVVLLLVQLNYTSENAPLLLQFVSLAGKTLQNGRFKSDFVKYYSIGNRIPGITSYAYDASFPVSTYNWLIRDGYYQNNNFAPYEGLVENIEASKNFAVLLLNTTKSKLPQENVDDRVKKLQYESGISGENRIYLTEENLVNFVLETVDDCMIFAVNEEELDENNLGRQLSILLNKPILHYDIRAQTQLSINVCGNNLIVAPSSPNADNNCDGIFTQHDCIFKSQNPMKSDLETKERPEFAQISKGCSLTWKSIQELINEEEKRFGTENLADFILSRGAGKFIDYTNSVSMEELQGLYICDKHFKELFNKWEDAKKLCVRGTCYCALGPYFETNQHEKKITSTGYINRAESFMILVTKGVLIPIGTPACRNHKQLVGSLQSMSQSHTPQDAVEYPPSAESLTPRRSRPPQNCYSGMDSTPQHLTSRHTEAFDSPCISDTEKEKLTKLLTELGYNPVKMEKSWNELNPRNQRKHAKSLRDSCRAIAETKTNSRKDAISLLKKSMEGFSFICAGSAKCDRAEETVKKFANFYLRAGSRTEGYQYLSLLATAYPFKTVEKYIPNLSPYAYGKAKKIGIRKLANQKPYETPRKSFLRGIDRDGLYDFASFLGSSPMATVLPYGETIIHLSDGSELSLPNAFRDFGATDTVLYYRAEKERRGETVKLSDSTMYRIYNICVARKRISLQCVDTFKAAGVKAFANLRSEVVAGLKEHNIISAEEHDKLEKLLLQSEHFLKTEYYAKLQMEHKSPYLCMKFALSDPEDVKFRSAQCSDPTDHLIECKECNSYHTIISELRNIITEAQESDSERPSFIQNSMLFFVETLKESLKYIDSWRAHIVRSRFANYVKEKIIENLTVNTCFMVADYSQKWLPREFNEPSSSYFGKTGLSLHVISTSCNISGNLLQHSFAHVMGYAEQNADIVGGIYFSSLKKLKLQDITSVILKSDNAGYYKSATLIQLIPSISQKSGVPITRYTFSEAQSGKDIADVWTSVIKRTFQARLDGQKNVQSADEMHSALSDAGEIKKLIGFSSINVQHIGERLDYSKSRKIAAVTNIGDIEYTYTADGATLRYWRHYHIGEGKTMQVKFTDFEVKEFKEEVCYTSNEFWRERSDVTDRTKESDVTPIIETDEETGLPRGLHRCPVDGCISEFVRYSSKERHVFIGKHNIPPVRETMEDISVKFYLSELEGMRQGYSFFRDNLYGPENEYERLDVNPLKQGWALKTRTPRASYTEAMIKFLEEKFLTSQQRGQKKLDPMIVAEEMRKAADPVTGRPLFTAEQRLSSSQIASFITQKLKKVQKRKKPLAPEEETPLTPEEERTENSEIFDEIAENTGDPEDESTDHPIFLDLTDQIIEEVDREILQELFM